MFKAVNLSIQNTAATGAMQTPSESMFMPIEASRILTLVTEQDPCQRRINLVEIRVTVNPGSTALFGACSPRQ